jgi:RNA polymerase sigma-70 factor, ECF subfamily
MTRTGTDPSVMPAPRSDDQQSGAVRPRSGSNITFAGDEALVAGLRRGSPAAKAAFFDAYHGVSRSILLHVLGRDAELDDILHDVFVNAFRSVSSVRDASTLKSWLARVTVFTARRVLRSRRRRAWLRLFVNDEQEELHEPVSPEDAHATYALRVAYGLLARLSADEQVVFGLHYVDGRSLSEIAVLTDVSLSTVKRRMIRARADFFRQAGAHAILSDWIREETNES